MSIWRSGQSIISGVELSPRRWRKQWSCGRAWHSAIFLTISSLSGLDEFVRQPDLPAISGGSTSQGGLIGSPFRYCCCWMYIKEGDFSGSDRVGFVGADWWFFQSHVEQVER